MSFSRFCYAILIVVLGATLVCGCSASRKIRAARILDQCELEISGASLDSVQVELDKIAGSVLGGLVPNPNAILLIQNLAKGMISDTLGTLYFAIHADIRNSSSDTLWLRSADGSVLLDSLGSLPIAFRDSAKPILPGVSTVELHTQLRIGPVMMKILAAKEIRFQGSLEFSLSPTGEPIPFAVNRQRKILPEERTAFIDKARTEILSTLTEIWASTLRR